jgi:poly-gamma-glutamate synthesis protein (capsule biosynthesis protein)
VILHGCGDLINDYEGIGDGHGGLPLDLGCLCLLELETAGGDRQRLEVVPFRRRRFRLCTAGKADREELDRLLGPLPAGVRIHL